MRRCGSILGVPAALLLLLAACACSRPAAPPAAPRPALDPAVYRQLIQEPGGQLFEQHGCVACHGPEGQYRDKLAGAPQRPDEDLVKWILDPQAFKPGTEMPAYEGTLSRDDARVLAAWVKRYAAQR